MNYTIYSPDCPPARRALVTALVDIEQDTGYYRQLFDLTGEADTLTVLLPRVATLETSSVCQISCSFCPCAAAGVLPPAEILLRRMAALAAGGVRALSLHYLGEPLLHPAFPELLAAAVARFSVVVLATNGLALDDAARAALLTRPPTRIGLSLDAAHIAAGVEAERVLAVLAELRLARDARGPSPAPALVILSTVTDHAAPTRADLKRWLGVADAVELRSLVPVREPGADHAGPPAEGHCPLAFSRAVVRHDGRVQICCSDYAGGLTLGNLDDLPLAEIWQGANAWRVRRRMLAGDWPEPCRDCASRTGVGSGMFVARTQELGAACVTGEA